MKLIMFLINLFFCCLFVHFKTLNLKKSFKSILISGNYTDLKYVGSNYIDNQNRSFEAQINIHKNKTYEKLLKSDKETSNLSHQNLTVNKHNHPEIKNYSTKQNLTMNNVNNTSKTTLSKLKGLNYSKIIENHPQEKENIKTAIMEHDFVHSVNETSKNISKNLIEHHNIYEKDNFTNKTSNNNSNIPEQNNSNSNYYPKSKNLFKNKTAGIQTFSSNQSQPTIMFNQSIIIVNISGDSLTFGPNHSKNKNRTNVIKKEEDIKNLSSVISQQQDNKTENPSIPISVINLNTTNPIVNNTNVIKKEEDIKNLSSVISQQQDNKTENPSIPISVINLNTTNPIVNNTNVKINNDSFSQIKSNNISINLKEKEIVDKNSNLSKELKKQENFTNLISKEKSLNNTTSIISEIKINNNSDHTYEDQIKINVAAAKLNNQNNDDLEKDTKTKDEANKNNKLEGNNDTDNIFDDIGIKDESETKEDVFSFPSITRLLGRLLM